MVTEATIVCPACGHARSETMPTDACQYLYVCVGCGLTMKPLPRDCCVFCSYADHGCPPKQGLNDGCDSSLPPLGGVTVANAPSRG
jgi:hypothetical protein